MERDQASKFINDLLKLLVTRGGSDLFLTAAAQLNVPIEHTVVVGDSIWDMLAASRCRRGVLRCHRGLAGADTAGQCDQHGPQCRARTTCRLGRTAWAGRPRKSSPNPRSGRFISPWRNPRALTRSRRPSNAGLDAPPRRDSCASVAAICAAVRSRVTVKVPVMPPVAILELLLPTTASWSPAAELMPVPST